MRPPIISLTQTRPSQPRDTMSRLLAEVNLAAVACGATTHSRARKGAPESPVAAVVRPQSSRSRRQGRPNRVLPCLVCLLMYLQRRETGSHKVVRVAVAAVVRPQSSRSRRRGRPNRVLPCLVSLLMYLQRREIGSHKVVRVAVAAVVRPPIISLTQTRSYKDVR
jgi:hypothetical protein